MQPVETNRRFSQRFIGGVLAFVFVATISGCNIFERFERKPKPEVVAVPDQMVPKSIKEGEAAPYDGWLFSTPLFNEYAPHWQKGPYGSDDE